MESSSRTVYSREIGELETSVLEMSSLAEDMVARAVDALQRMDPGLARAVMQDDDELDIKEIGTEQRCLRLLALHQPMATDLREIGTVIKIITDIERMGDLAVDVAKISLKVEAELGSTNYVDIPLMSNVARQMLRQATQMFVQKDASMIFEIQKLEDRVDELYRILRGQIFAHMIDQPDEAVSAGWLLLAIHHVERMADHALNIAERCYFMVTGDVVPRVED